MTNLRELNGGSALGFRAYWRWKSRRRLGRPRVSRELRELIRRMSKENPLWGAPRIRAVFHGNASYHVSARLASVKSMSIGQRLLQVAAVAALRDELISLIDYLYHIQEK